MGTKLNPNALKQGSITFDKLNLKVGDLDDLIQNKVDKQDGKGLSTNDYTSTEKTKLAGIANGANVNVQPDWNVTDTSSDAYIKNKPSKVTETTVSGWGFTKNTGTVTSITPGTGLSGDDAITTSGTINLKTATDSEIGGIKVGYSENGKNYPVELDANNKAYVNVPWTDNNTTSFTITATATDDDVVVLSGTNGSNKVTYDAKHRKQFGETTKVGADKYVSNNGTTSISGYGASGTIKIPQITVNEYGHITAATDESVTITMPSAQTIPTTLKNPYSLKFGSKTYDGSSEKEITASDLGLSAALNYCGITTTALTDGATTNPVVINGSNHTAKAGCTVFYGDKEFVFNGTSWEEIGFSVDLSGYKTKQTAVSSPSASGSTTAFIDTISQDANGTITVTKKNVDLSSKAPNNHASTATTYGVGTASNYGHVKLATGDMNGAANVDGVAVSKNHTHSQYSTTGHTHSYLPLSGGTLTGNLTFDCSNNVDRYITFDSMDSPNAFTWRMGHLASGSNDANYLVFQSSHGSTASSVKWTNALKLGLQTFDATFAGNILPSTNLTKNLGSNTASFVRTYTRYVDTADTYYLRLCSSGKELMTLNCDSDRIDTTAHILPTATQSYDLGSTSAKWKNVHAKTLYGSVGSPNLSTIDKNHTISYIGGQKEVTSTPTADKIYVGSSSDSDVVSVAKLDGSSTVANVMNLRVHFNSAYYHDIGMYPNNADIYHRAVVNGTALDWKKFVLSDMDNNITGTISNVKITPNSDNVACELWFCDSSRTLNKGTITYDNDLRYNPSTNQLMLGNMTATTAAPTTANVVIDGANKKISVGSSFIQYNSTTGCLEITA